MVMYVWGLDNFVSSDPGTQSLDVELNVSCEEVLLLNTRIVAPLDGPSKTKEASQRNFLDILKENDDLYKTGVPPIKVMDLDVLRHSADQNHVDWVRLAVLIREKYHKYRGFVVYNGTDNMVATATALSFMLENLGKPVIFTGSRIPPDRLYTDLKRNLVIALLFANCGQISEVCILFDDQLFRANRTVKVSRSNLAPFDSPHFPPLATMYSKMTLHRPFLRPYPRRPFRVMENMGAVVQCLRLGPSARRRILTRFIELTKARAIVIVAYGGGNAPTRDGYMKELVKMAVDRDIIVVVCTQNLYGSVDLGAYATGNQLMEAGAIASRDMTISATIMKLKYLIGLGLPTSEIKGLFTNANLRGELSPPRARL